MAFRPLTEAECGQKNPLARLASHITHDHTFSDSHGQVFPNSSDQLVEQFLQETRAIPQTFRMDDLMREMHEIESQRSAIPPIPATTIKDQLHDNSWAQQYIEDGKQFHEVPNNEAIWAEIASEEQREHNAQQLSDAWAADILSADPEGYLLPDELHHQIDLEDSKYVYSKFMRFMKTEGEGDVGAEAGKLTEKEAEEWEKQYLSSEDKQPPATLTDKWVDEYAASGSGSDRLHSGIWETFQKEMENMEDADTSQSWIDEFSSYYNTGQKEYAFTEENPMSEMENPLERGKKFLEENDVPSAVLCFEAAVKKEPDNALAWQLLGMTQAENEQDPLAIIALKKCIQLDPTNLTSLMALAVSYTNENYYNQACEMLLQWMRSNPKYADLVPDTNQSVLYGQVTSFLVDIHYKMVQSLFIKAAQRNPQDVDYQVQCGLGVLFNLSGEYDKAADCFRAALSVKPDDARLWNRLGATLANGSQPEEAVDAYHHALNLAPGFIRARYNVGVTCINLRAYKEAAEHFLTALNHQARVKDVTNSGSSSQMSDTIWSALMMCVGFLNRNELKPLVENRDLKELNKAFGID